MLESISLSDNKKDNIKTTIRYISLIVLLHTIPVLVYYNIFDYWLIYIPIVLNSTVAALVLLALVVYIINNKNIFLKTQLVKAKINIKSMINLTLLFMSCYYIHMLGFWWIYILTIPSILIIIHMLRLKMRVYNERRKYKKQFNIK